MPNKKTKSKPKNKKVPTKVMTKKPVYTTWPFITLGCIIIIFLSVFVSRGWLRVTVIPKGLTPFYSSSVKSTLNSENVSIHKPLSTLGSKIESKATTCSLEEAQGIHTEIDCYAQIQTYTQIQNSIKSDIELWAQAEQDYLVSNGWKSGSNGVTLTSLIDGIYQGKDYSPDAFYEKVIGSNDCIYDTMIAYANPQPPAINTMLSCSRTINVLGSPKDEIYNSSKGIL
jgi:hypothetical protein